MVRSVPLDSQARPDPSRILAIAVAIAVHAFAFLLLLVPMAVPPLQALVEPKPEVIFLPPKEKVVELKPVDPQKQRPVTRPQDPRPVRESATPQHQPEVIVDEGSVPAQTADAYVPGPSVPEAFDPGPISVGNLGYARATPPPYPRAELHKGIEGTVMLKVLVDVDGTPLEVSVQQSSGNRALDRSAREHVLKHWRFQPATRDGSAVQAYGVVPIVFSLQ